ncbi:MAG: ROK family transcriptional regulator, partial [Janthinobacterium lividum]
MLVLRRNTRALVLDQLVRAGNKAVTAAELMAATSLSRASVHAVCEVLIDLGLVVEVDGRRPEGRRRAGRTARAYQFDARMAYVIGVDLGDHKVAVAISDLTGHELGSRTESFAHLGANARDRVTTTRRLMRSVLREAGVEPASLICIAVGVAAPVGESGRVVAGTESSYLPGLAGVDIAKSIGRGYDCPVLVENDANVAALGERWRGAGVGVDNLVVLLSGERLGAGLINGGQLVRGQHHLAGELAFLELVAGVEDTTGIAGMTQTLGRRAVADSRHGTEPPGLLYMSSNGDPSKVGSEQVIDSARHGDPEAVEILHRVAERMARVVAVLATLLDPEVLVFSGGGAAVAELIRDDISRRVPAFVPEPPRIVASPLGDRVVLVGATRLALDNAHDQLFTFLDTDTSWR